MNMKYENDYRQLGLKIAYYRKLRGFTQEQFAEKDRREHLRKLQNLH